VSTRYETWYGGEVIPHLRFSQAVETLASTEGVRRLCEIGGGANPIMSLAVAESAGVVDYVITDLSEEELAKAPEGYQKAVLDVTRGRPEDLGAFDLIVSHTVAEHVNDAAGFHRTVFDMLAPGGRAIHFFPTLYEPAFVLNRWLPEAAADSILQRIQTNRARGGKHEKFPAYYRWCRGPTRRQLARLRSIGFEVDEYVGIFGHGYYGAVPVIDRVETAISEVLLRHPVPALTAYAWVTLRRP
jgi:SAM-dependent methyltransferase